VLHITNEVGTVVGTLEHLSKGGDVLLKRLIPLHITENISRDLGKKYAKTFYNTTIRNSKEIHHINGLDYSAEPDGSLVQTTRDLRTTLLCRSCIMSKFSSA
jgi:hypothetical protein